MLLGNQSYTETQASRQNFSQSSLVHQCDSTSKVTEIEKTQQQEKKKHDPMKIGETKENFKKLSIRILRKTRQQTASIKQQQAVITKEKKKRQMRK